jgi:co-chaperonin GroES (HSP10)
MVTPTYEHAFPEVDPGIQPFGSRVLVQIRNPKQRTASGIILDAGTKETEKWNTQVAKVISVGPLAFKNRTTMDSWPEGDWCQPGEFVRVPKYGGDRWEVDLGEQGIALFVIFNDLDIIGRVTGDPTAIRAFI